MKHAFCTEAMIIDFTLHYSYKINKGLLSNRNIRKQPLFSKGE